ncbi:MAG: hypothetical protein OEZ58_06660 [Gammaproteobacteria bacterium]|nr:hypothetical protein [Gammaproteobacteria bacterium]
MENMLLANNEMELENVLRSVDISVPRRSEGRTKEHTERYAIAHMLSALMGKDQLTYPLELIQRERPDFLLKGDEIQIGIEHTEAVPQNEAHKTVLRDKVDGPDVHFILHHQPGEAKKPAKELIEEIQANQSGPGWEGDSVEREWSEAMLHFINRKIEASTREGFEKFEQNWLLIYDNWSLPALDREKARRFLLPRIIESTCFDSFDFVYIITGNIVLAFSNSGVVQHEINNLWN